MKLLILLLLIPYSAVAGAPNCTDVKTVTTSSAYTVLSTDCIVNLINPDQVGDGSVAVPVIFPHTTTAAEFTVTEDSDFTTDECANYSSYRVKRAKMRHERWAMSLPEFDGYITVCQPNGWSVRSTDSGVTVDGSASETLSGQYVPDPNSAASYSRESVRYIWDGTSNWAPAAK